MSRPGWASGNALALLITGTGHRTARSFEQGAANGALLHIEYGVGPPPPNVAPVVDAGPGGAVTRPASFALNGTVTDDGRPVPPGAVTTQWVKASGPGTVTFGNPNAIDTQASFSLEGIYVLRLTANDGEAATADSVEVDVAPAGPDSPPVVDAGPDRVIALPASAALDGTVSDDGQPIPPGAVTKQWTKGSGPGTVTFVNPNAVDTQASFSAGGTYVLRLTANDGATSVYDSMQVTVAATFEKRIAAGADDAEETATGTMDLASSDLELVQDVSTQKVGLRFTTVSIPAGATIVNAWVQFVTDEVQSEATSLTIRGQAIANAPAFSSTNKISTRTGTTASAVWTPAAWTTNGQAGANQRTPDLTGVIQELVNTPGWAPNNSVVLLINGTGHRTARAFEQGAANSALLHIEYR